MHNDSMNMVTHAKADGRASSGMTTFPRIIDTLQLSLQASNLRHQVLSNNIANVNVPRYQGVDVVFEDELRRALEVRTEEGGLRGLTTHDRHLPIPSSAAQHRPVTVGPRLVPLSDRMRQDGNNIDVEDQMAKMAANQLWYQALVRSVSDEFGRLRSAISEGRR